MSERHPHPPNQKQAAATKDAGLHSTCHLTCFSPVSSTLGSIFLSRTSTIEWREAGLARGQIGCPYFIFSFTNILVWDFQHSLWPCAWAPPRHVIWLVVACFSAARYPAKKFYWKMSAHCTHYCVVSLVVTFVTDFGKVTRQWQRWLVFFFSSSFIRFCSDLP